MFHSLLASLSFLYTWLRAENHRTEPLFSRKTTICDTWPAYGCLYFLPFLSFISGVFLSAFAFGNIMTVDDLKRFVTKYFGGQLEIARIII